MSDGEHVALAVPKGRVQATCIRVWRRGAPGVRWIMSISSGPKDCFVNDAMTIMEKQPEVDAVALMNLPGPIILYLREIRGKWYDCLGAEARMEPVLC